MPEQLITSTKVSAAKEFLRAEITSIDKENRTFEAVLATETPVTRFDWSDYKYFDEVLECTPEAVDGVRVEKGVAPFLDNHNSYSSDSGLGVLESWTAKSGKVMVKVRMSTRPNDPKLEGIWHDIHTGIRKAISCKYKVLEYVITKNEQDNQRDEHRATKWEILEGSTVLIPADPYSGVRSEGEAKKMQIPSDLVEVRTINNFKTEEKAMSANPTDQTVPQTPVPAPGPDLDKIRSEAAAEAKKEAIIEERKRSEEIGQIRSIFEGKGVNLTPEFWDKAVSDGSTPDQVRSIAMAEWAKADPSKGASGGAASVGADREKFKERMLDALDLNLNGSRAEADMKPERIEAAREFRALKPMRIADTFASRTEGYNRYDSEKRIVERALGLGEFYGVRAQTTSDLPVLLTDLTMRTLRRTYNERDHDWEKLVNITTANDLRDIKRASLGSAPPLSLVGENQEYPNGGLASDYEVVSIDKYGSQLPISWESFVNDDLSALSRVPQIWASQVSDLHNNLAMGAFIDNPNLQDGTPLFHTSRGNYISSGTALSVDSVAAMLVLMKEQSGKPDASGNTIKLNLKGKYLVVGTANMHKALQLFGGNILATEVDKTNPYKGLLEVIVDPLVSGTNWYIFEDPRRIDTVEVRFLQGQRYFIERYWDPKIDAWVFKVRTVAGATPIDFRGIYRNAGA